MTYESLVDWTAKTDYLRCSPKFHGRSRYDFVFANLQGGPAFAQLVFIFTCQVNEKNYQLALVQPLKKYLRPATKVQDKALSIHRWKAQSRDKCQVIPLDCVIRGAVLVKDPAYAADYFVIDMLDGDMYLRVKSPAS